MSDTLSSAEQALAQSQSIMAETGFVLPDLSDPKNQGSAYGPAPYGDYLLRVDVPLFKKSADKGTPSLNLELSIIQPEIWANKKMWRDIWLTPKAIRQLSWFLRCIGSDLWNKNLAQIPAPKFLEVLTFATVVGRVGTETFMATDKYEKSPTYGQLIPRTKNVVERFFPKDTLVQYLPDPGATNGASSPASGGVLTGAQGPMQMVQTTHPGSGDFSVFTQTAEQQEQAASNPNQPPVL